MTDTLNPRTRMLLEAPIAPTLLRLAAPNVLVMLAQAGVGLIETYFVGKLGTDALAGMALVFTCTVTSIRPASAEEVEHGHVHEDGDCEHDD